MADRLRIEYECARCGKRKLSGFRLPPPALQVYPLPEGWALPGGGPPDAGPQQPGVPASALCYECKDLA